MLVFIIVPWTARRSNQSILKEMSPGCSWKDWCYSWNSNTLATCCKELTPWKRPWCWERLKAGGEGNNRGWDGWMASPTRWTWVWMNSGSWWWTGRPGVLWFMGSQTVRNDWATELNWIIIISIKVRMNNKWNETHRHSNISWGIPLYITILRVQFSHSVMSDCDP